MRFNVSITSRTYFRVRFAGDADYKATLSAKVAFVPKVALGTPSAAYRQRAGRAFTASGRIYPAHTAGTRIKIERYLIVRGKRVYRGYVWAKVPARNRYTYSTRLTLGQGHLAAASGCAVRRRARYDGFGIPHRIGSLGPPM